MLCQCSAILSLAALLTTLAFVAHANAADQKAHLLLKAHAMVESVNTANVGWKAQVYPRFAQMAPEQRRAMNGLNWDPKASKENFRVAKEPNSRGMPDSPILLRADELPEEFDPRVQWPECKEVINNIRDQSKCGDCWAVAAAGAFSDRICIASGGKHRPSVSSIDTASCAMEEADGCQGAKTLEPAWAYFQKSGVVSGSGYESRQGCKPYPFPLSVRAKRSYMAPICTPACTNAWHKGTYKEDKIYADKPIQLHSKEWKNKELLLKQEIYQHGPVAVGFIVFDDFYYYHNGIYHQLSTEAEGGHAVRLVGWGVEKGQPYWLVANSWGPDWGEGGFFRISRGTNEAYIEEIDAYAGMPILPTEK